MTGGDIRLPAGEFYWAVLPVPAGRMLSTRRRRRLGYQLEEVMPVPIEQVHVAWTLLPGSRALACAMDLGRLGAAAASGPLTLGPAAVPEHLGVDINPRCINLLTGPHSPAPVQRLSRMGTRAFVVAAVLAIAMSLQGFQSRIDTAEASTRSLQAEAEAILTTLFPGEPGGSTPAFARMTAELRSLRTTRTQAPSATFDAAADLTALLAAWPSYLHVRTESLSVAGTGISLIVTVTSHAEAEQLAAALAHVEGWYLDQPQITVSKDSIRVALRLARDPGGSS